MIAVVLWFVAGLALVAGLRYLITWWFGADEPEGAIDKSEVRLQSMMRWFSGNWPDSTTPAAQRVRIKRDHVREEIDGTRRTDRY